MREELEKKEAVSGQGPEERTQLTAAGADVGGLLEQKDEPKPEQPDEPERDLLENEPKPEQPDETTSRKSFVIKRRSDAKKDSRMQVVTEKQFRSEHPGLLPARKLSKEQGPLLVISQRAEREIKDHIGWAEKTRYNIREQGGIMIGSPYLVDGRTVSVVECAIPAELSESNAAYLKMDTETWLKMLNCYDESYRDQGLYVVGWFHTHPNGLGVFMSSTDMGTQRAFFREDWHFAVVLNPHRKMIACFHSAQAELCSFYPANFVDR